MQSLAPVVRAGAWLAVTAAAALLTARLGFWQLDRARQKTQLQQTIQTRAELAPLPPAQLAADASGASAQHYRRITLTGHWLDRFTVFLDNRQMEGRPGFFVVTPLLLAPHDAVLVQRGWVPRDPADRTHLPDLLLPQDEVQVHGRVAPPPARLFDFGGRDDGRIRQNIDVQAYAREIGVPLRPLSLQQLEAPHADGLLRDWPLPAVDVSRNRGYALQWFAFSALTVGWYAWFQVLRPFIARGRS